MCPKLGHILQNYFALFEHIEMRPNLGHIL